MTKTTEPDAPLLQAISKRYSPRAFAAREPSTDELEQVFEAARWAASCFNDQPWAFIVTRRSEAAAHAKALAGLVEANQVWAAAAPVLGFSLARTHFAFTGEPNRHAWHDVGAAMAQLSIQAASFGLMVHQMAGIQRDVVRENFTIPAGHEVVAGFAIGWPGDPQDLPEGLRERELAPRTRKPLAELLVRGALESSLD